MPFDDIIYLASHPFGIGFSASSCQAIVRNVTIKLHGLWVGFLGKYLENELHSEGRVLIRPSDTYTSAGFLIEGKDRYTITVKATEHVKFIKERLG